MAAVLREVTEARCSEPGQPGLDAFLARQPIFDGKLDVVAYELLYRRTDTDRAEVTDGNQATTQLVVSAFMDFDLGAIVGEAPAYINVTGDLLTAGHIRGLPRDKVVLEVLENVPADDPAILAELRDLRRDGFVVALDDFVLHDGTRALLEVADIVKLDVRALGYDRMAEHVRALRAYPVKLLAEKVESHDELEWCRELGCDLFQGYFFVRPETLGRKRVPTNRMAALQMLSRLNDPNCSVMEIAEMVKGDVAISYRVMQYINSPFCGLRREVTSVNHAVVLLGLSKLQQLVNLLVLSGVDDKPGALVALALTRARLCEHLAEQRGLADPGRYFTAGLLSMLEAFLDMPLAPVVEKMRLAPELTRALLEGAGVIGDVLSGVLAYERGDWNALTDRGFEAHTVQRAYLDAVTWADGLARLCR